MSYPYLYECRRCGTPLTEAGGDCGRGADCRPLLADLALAVAGLCRRALAVARRIGSRR